LSWGTRADKDNEKVRTGLGVRVPAERVRQSCLCLCRVRWADDGLPRVKGHPEGVCATFRLVSVRVNVRGSSFDPYWHGSGTKPFLQLAVSPFDLTSYGVGWGLRSE
jgi:hypothetical protein